MLFFTIAFSLYVIFDVICYKMMTSHEISSVIYPGMKIFCNTLQYCHWKSIYSMHFMQLKYMRNRRKYQHFYCFCVDFGSSSGYDSGSQNVAKMTLKAYLAELEKPWFCLEGIAKIGVGTFPYLPTCVQKIVSKIIHILIDCGLLICCILTSKTVIKWVQMSWRQTDDFLIDFDSNLGSILGAGCV